jgi:predicted N-acetyltransferase YhbS
MEARFDRARREDYEEVIDFGNFVFSQAHNPHDFPALLPKLYRRDYFMDGIHYVAREGGRIKAVVGAYPLKMEFSAFLAGALSGRGIGMVSVHPYCRSRGYMKVLMNMALKDMQKDGVVFSCLGGQRQRYEYFGYAPAGTAYTFICREANILHTLGRDWKTGLSIRPADAGGLDGIAALHEAKAARLERKRERLFDILSSWKGRIFTVHGEGGFEGYFVYHGSNNEIGEINLNNLSRLPELIGLFLQSRKEAGAEAPVRVVSGPHETEKTAVLAGFAEDYSVGPVYHFAVFDFLRFTRPFLALRARERSLCSGSFVFEIEGGKRFCLSAAGGVPEIGETLEAPDCTLSSREAVRLLFSPLGGRMVPAVRENAFLQCLLPLPLFFESSVGV